jgi:membrane protein
MPILKSKKKELLLFTGSLRPALALFSKNDPMRLAGATAFFTTFALPPIIFLLANLFGLFIGRQNMGRGLLRNLSNVMGEDSANQLRQVIRSIRGFDDSWYVIVIGCLFLFFVSTTLFIVIKNSLNQLWQLHVKSRPGLLFFFSIRLRSFAVILVVGILFLADNFIDSLQAVAVKYIDDVWQGGGAYFKTAMNEVAGTIIITAWFVVLFRFLADGRPTWKASLLGGILTGVLFAIGRFLLGILLINSNIGLLYGPAGSLVLVLLFVFYSSFILYYGACFIAIYSEKKGWPLKPNVKAFRDDHPVVEPLAESDLMFPE